MVASSSTWRKLPVISPWSGDPEGHSMGLLARGIPLVYKLDAYLKPIPNVLSSQLMTWPSVTSGVLGGMAKIVIPGLMIPSGTPVVFEPDTDLKPIPNEFSSRFMAIPSVPS